MANISTLTVNLVADTARFTVGLKKSRREANSFGRSVRRSLLPIVSVAGAATAALTVLGRNAIATADQIGKTAKAVGVSAETLQELRFAAKQSGVEVRGIDDSIRRFNRRLGEFANSGGGPAAVAIKALGVNIREAGGGLRSTESVFNATIDSLASVESQAQRAALAAQLFGDDFGPKLLPLLDQGTEGIAKLRREARDLGIVLSNSTVASAERAQDQFGRLEAVVSGNLTKAFADNAEAIVAATEALTDFVIGAINLGNQVRKFYGFLTPREEVKQNIQDLTDRIRELNGEIKNPPQQGSQRPLINPGGIAIGNTQAPARDTQEAIRIRDGLLSQLDEEVAKLRRIEESEAAILALRRESGSTGGGTAFSTRAPTLPGVELSEELKDRYDLARDSIQQNIDLIGQWEREATQAFQNTRTPVEEFNATVQRLLANPFIDGDLQEREINRAIETLHAGLGVVEQDVNRLSEFTAQAARNIQDSFSDFFFDPFNDGLDGLLQSFTDTIRRMLANLLASDLLNFLGGLGGPFGSFFSLASGSLGPPAALGGFRRGRPFIAGEFGPEVVNPGPTGVMVSAGGGGPTFNINNNISGANDPQSTRRLLEENNRLVVAEVFERLERGRR